MKAKIYAALVVATGIAIGSLQAQTNTFPSSGSVGIGTTTSKQANISGHGKGSVSINASTLAAGTYNYSLWIEGKLIDTKQMILTK